ncbi:MAG: HD domain-containing phosphohydrolase [Candidatus Zixiibacteriota bacterium]
MEAKEKLEKILNITSQLITIREPDIIMSKISLLSKEIFDADLCHLFLYDKINNNLWTIGKDNNNDIIIPCEDNIESEVLHNKSPIFIPRTNTRHPIVDSITEQNLTSLMSMPLIDSYKDVIGVLHIGKTNGKLPFDRDDLDLLGHLAIFVSKAFENIDLHLKLRQSQRDIVYRLSYAMSFKDPETEDHIVRVGMYCSIIAREMGFDSEVIETIMLAAPMHDIGKVGIPDRILLKPAKLNTGEWELMKLHSLFGFNILKESDSNLLKMAAIIALEHHEKWDGSGYPEGKKAEEISIYGRIAAIADVFDALTSDRPYKNAWPIDNTIDFIKEKEGIFFDPKVYEIFMANIEEIIQIRRELSI